MNVGRPAFATHAIVAGILLTAGTTPGPASAQEAPPDLGVERLTTFAKVHLAIAEARDEYHGEIGRIHEEQARLRARQELNEKVAGILEDHELTREEYDHFILIISIDAETREAFEKILAELVEGRVGG